MHLVLENCVKFLLERNHIFRLLEFSQHSLLLLPLRQIILVGQDLQTDVSFGWLLRVHISQFLLRDLYLCLILQVLLLITVCFSEGVSLHVLLQSFAFHLLNVLSSISLSGVVG